jgi:hypothetical protein
MTSARVRTIVVVALVAVSAGLLALPANASIVQTINLWSHRITGAPPTVDGVVGANEWPWTPQITITSSYVNPAPYSAVLPDAPAYATIAFTNTDLYILVDVVGDQTQDTGDECLFWIRVGSTTYVVDIWGGGSHDSVGGDRAVGFGTSPNSSTNHRIYEFRVPLSAMGVTVGQTVGLCSPYFKSSPSMGFDSTTGHDNIWPPNLDPSNVSTWAALQLNDPPAAIPELTPVGVGLLAILLGLVAVAVLRRTTL